MKKKFYRVCHKETLQGLWYAFNGEFTGFIHNQFNFCMNNQLEMDFDPELVGWLSATDDLDTLYAWFSKDDILKLQEHGWFIHEFEADEYKFYERFQHLIIKQDSSKVLNVIVLNDKTIDNTLVNKFEGWIGEDGLRYFKHLKGLTGTYAPVLNLNMVTKGLPFHNVHLNEGMQIRNWMRNQDECVGWNAHELDDNWIELVHLTIEKLYGNK